MLLRNTGAPVYEGDPIQHLFGKTKIHVLRRTRQLLRWRSISETVSEYVGRSIV